MADKHAQGGQNFAEFQNGRMGRDQWPQLLSTKPVAGCTTDRMVQDNALLLAFHYLFISRQKREAASTRPLL